MSRKLIPKVECIPNLYTYPMMSVSSKTIKWISTKMKNKNKIHIHPVNYIRDFFIMHILML
jgi:hypothetical protein